MSTPRPATVRRIAVLLAVVQTLALTFAVSHWWAQRQNTLFRKSGWVVGKETGKFVFYTFDFLFRPIERGEVNLTADMGFQELLSRDPEGPGRRLESIACTARISHGGYLWVEVGKRGGRALACRLSRNSGYPSGFSRFGPEGDLLAFTPLSTQPVLAAGRPGDRVELVRGDGSWSILLNGLTVGTAPDDLPADGTFGFRGSGVTRRRVVVRDVALRFVDPRTGRTWTERETFTPRLDNPGLLAAALAFAVVTLLLRRWRRTLACGLLTPAGRELLERVDEIGTTTILSLLAAATALAPPLGGLTFAAILAAELVYLVGLGLASREAPLDPGPHGRRAAATFAAALALLAAAGLARHGDLLGWGRHSTWRHIKNVHPDALVLRPAATRSSPPFAMPAARSVVPGAPYFPEGAAWRGQLIRLSFVPPPAGTLDLVFQQQSFLTRGDPRGEEIPIQRRLLRLTTRGDVAGGLALGTHKAPSPFFRVHGALSPGRENLLEVRSDERGIGIVLNGSRTFVPEAKPLGYGETGLIAWDGPVEVLSLSVEPTASQSARDRLLPLAGLLLPLVTVGALWGALRLGGRVPFAPTATLALGALAPAGVYLAAALLIDRNTLLLLNRERVGWLNLALVAAVCSLPVIVLVLRRHLRGAVWFFQVSLGAVLAAGLFAAISHLATSRPELLRRWIPVDDVVVPGDLVEPKAAGGGPWYANERRVGASNYVWRQAFGTKRISGPKSPGSVRVFLMGGSQAWGSGAADSFSTFDQLLERRLAGRGLPVEVYNAGINGAGVSGVRWAWQGLAAPLSPDILILDVGLNDSAALGMIANEEKRRTRRAALLEEFTAILDRCREDNVEVLLVLEPMCEETPLRPDAEYYAALGRLAAERGIRVLSPQAEFGRLERTHLLWWDTAHLAPFGHEFMSRFLEAPVAEAVGRRLAAEVR